MNSGCEFLLLSEMNSRGVWLKSDQSSFVLSCLENSSCVSSTVFVLVPLLECEWQLTTPHHTTVQCSYWSSAVLTTVKIQVEVFWLVMSQPRRPGLETQTGLRAEGIFFTSPPLPDRLWGPPILLSNVYRGIKRREHEADHSPQSLPWLWMPGAIPPLIYTSACCAT
jgi:hypothetical protein